MRLWHEELLAELPRQQLLGQHRECCALRGKGWGKAHSTVNYVFDHSLHELELYHAKVMQEMNRRGYRVAEQWLHSNYRGKQIESQPEGIIHLVDHKIYPEHNEAYLQECLDNLAGKGIYIKGSVKNLN